VYVPDAGSLSVYSSARAEVGEATSAVDGDGLSKHMHCRRQRTQGSAFLYAVKSGAEYSCLPGLPKFKLSLLEFETYFCPPPRML
jgi:hypothetical protein